MTEFGRRQFLSYAAMSGAALVVSRLAGGPAAEAQGATLRVTPETYVADIAPALADSFIEAELKRFNYEQLDEAIAWAAAEVSRAG